MSLLIDLAGQLAPHFSFFAARMADGVMQSTVQRISDRTVEASEGAFRSLVGRDAPAAGDEAALTPQTADDLDRRLGELTDEQRARLAAALLTWLRSPQDDRPGLVALVAAGQPHPAPPGPGNHVVSHGDNNMVIGSVGTFNQYPRDDRP
ncbi:hypothetical protein [Streptomyces sp. NPDC019224]|uniref:hypothetical protein n=1 Tax=Streptomyces sp. NPDC019224 TaxID=3154484 RepID=UPI0033E74463